MRAPKFNKPTVVPIETTATIMLGMWNPSGRTGEPQQRHTQGIATAYTLGLAAPVEFDCVRDGIDVASDGSRETLSSGA
jgi:hypothetical protein